MLVLVHHYVEGKDELWKSGHIKSFMCLAVGSGGETVLRSAFILLLGGLGMKYGACRYAWKMSSS